MEILKRARVLDFDLRRRLRTDEVEKLEKIVAIQNRIMSELSADYGRNLIRLFKLKGVL